MNRAFSILEIKSLDAEQRTIRGVATTPAADRMGDVVEPLGVKFANPLALLWQHRHDQPVGQVTFDPPTAAGITFSAQLAQIDEPGPLKDQVDLAWQSVKAELVRAVSIGFRPLEYSVMEDGGYRFLEIEVLELSLVTIPANAEATITQIRSIDAQTRAATGLDRDRTPRPGAAGLKSTLKAQEGRKMPKTTAELIAGYEATRAAKAARMDALMNKANDEGVTLDAVESQEYDTLDEEIADVDKHLVRLRKFERTSAAAAVPVAGQSVAEADRSRAAVRVEVRGPNVPKGTAFTRFAIALARSRGNLMQAAEIAKAWDDTPEVEIVLRAAVAAGTTTDSTWAAPLVPYQQMASEFIELLRPQTVLGKIPGLRRVPFNISMPRQTSGASVGWVGEGAPKPLTKGAFDTVTLRFAKAAGIVVLTDELVRFSNPSAEAIVQADLIAAMAQFLDVQFLDPDIAAVANVSPASITNGVAGVHATGTDADALRADILSLKNGFRSHQLSSQGAVFIMSETLADGIGMMTTALGQPAFPAINANGGELLGLPAITSQSDSLIDSGSPDGNRLILVKPSEIMLADDGQVMLDASREASLEMSNSPTATDDASTVHVSMFQRNMVALRAERWINWQARRTGAVQFISGAAYGS